MNPDAKLIGSAEQQFGTHCARAGLLAFRLLPDGLIEPIHPVGDEIDRLLRSEQLGAMLAAQLSVTASREPIELYPGCRVAVAEPAKTGETNGLLLIEPSGLLHPVFDQICDSVGLNRDVMVRNLEPYIKHNPSQCAQALYAFLQFHDALTAAQKNQHLIDQFALNLGQAYEELNLFFRLAKSLNTSNDPARTITSFCEELRNILPFQWVAATFFGLDLRLPELNRRTLSAGKLPCDPALLSDAARQACERGGEHWVRINNPSMHPLASAAGSQVICERLTDGQNVIGALMVGGKQAPDCEVISGELQLIEAAASFISIFRENVARLAGLKALFVGTVRSLAASIDAKDHYTRGHSERVSMLSAALARALGMDLETAEQYRITGLLHDVGKIGIPESILTKQGHLTLEEFRQIQRHPRIGYDILKAIPGIAFALPGVLHHHEKFDGTGYPDGLAGEQIPLIARVLALADTFDAMRSDRSYRSAVPHETVLEEIRRCAGTQFDPHLARLFTALDFSEFDRMLAAEANRSVAA